MFNEFLIKNFNGIALKRVINAFKQKKEVEIENEIGC